MDAELRYLDGARAGQTRVIRKEFATIGRHPSADVPFDPDRDLEVSARHAAIFREEGGWVVRDLGSTNGTWVNGARLKGDRRLEPNDTIRFGAAGPRLAFVPASAPADTLPATRPMSPPPAPAPRRSPERAARAGTTERIRVEVRRQTTGWRRAAIAAAALGLVAVLAAAGVLWRRTRALDAERAELLARTDSLLRRLDATTSTVAELGAALVQARSETEGLRASIASGRLSSDRMDALSRELASSLDRHEAVLRAARLDAAAIARDNADAIGLLVSEFPDGRRVAGTAFVVRARGDSGWIATSRHLVLDSLGRRATRLGILFNGSNQNFRVEAMAYDSAADLAVALVRVRGGVPAVRGLESTARAGDPVAIMGFPYGFDLPLGSDWRRTGVSASTFAGSIRKAAADVVEVDAYGAGGSSGSPVFNAAGEVIGIVYGGDPRTAGRIVYAVPAGRLESLLRSAAGN